MTVIYILSAIGGLALAAGVVLTVLGLLTAHWENADSRIERERGRSNRP